MKQPHGNTGNRHAALDEEPLVRLHIKLTKADKKLIEDFCQERNYSLSSFARAALLAEVEGTQRTVPRRTKS